MTRRQFPLLFAAGGALALPDRIRVAATPHLAMSPLHLAVERGYFRQQNLEVELIPLRRSADAIPILAKGDMDAALYAINPPLINAITKGAKIRLVAARDQALPDCGDVGSIYARRGIARVADLKGKRIANGSPAGIVEFALDSALERAGLALSDVAVVRLRPNEAMAAYSRGEIDALTGPDLSNMKSLQAAGFSCLTTLGKTRPGFQHGHIAFGRALLEGPLDMGARFLRAYFRGVSEYAGGVTPAFMTEYAAQTDLDPKAVVRQCRTHVIPGGQVQLASLDLFARWAYRKGYCEQPVDVAALVDDRFLKASKGK
ncbi:MAG: ABC transporter substrate-binding protein [Bryobacterales bacterium]|nr:ABC transporter substrate-binding protein [Bryobacterales bacterium]